MYRRMMPVSRNLVSAPAAEPISLADAKEHLNIVNSTDDDDMITRWIAAVRRDAEQYMHRAIITQTWDFFWDTFPGVIYVPNSPVQSVTSLKYYDTNNTEQTLSSALYESDLNREPAIIRPVSAQTWPSTYDRMAAVTLRVVCGYGDASAVPEDIIAGMLTWIANLYMHRGETEQGKDPQHRPFAYEQLMLPHRVY